MACMFQGMMLLSVGLGRLSPQKLVILYDQLLNLPAALKTIEIVGTFFILLGFILLLFASRTKQIPKTITVEQEGQSLNITYKTVIDFIEEVGSQNPYVTHFIADFINDHRTGIIIPVDIELNGVPSVHHILNEMENTLRSEIGNVFGLKKFKFEFHVQGVSIDPKKKYFAASAHQPAIPEPEKTAAVQTGNAVLKKEGAVEENVISKRSDEEIEQLFETDKKDTKKPSLVSRILWGK